jgi:hypothetical protein
MGKTVENTSGALKELQAAEVRQKRSYKWIAGILIGTVVILSITIISL